MAWNNRLACACSSFKYPTSSIRSSFGRVRLFISRCVNHSRVFERQLIRRDLSERSEMSAFLFKQHGRLFARRRVNACVRDTLEPVQTLRVEIVQTREAPAIEKIVFDVIDHPLDFAFRARTTRLMSLDGDSVMTGEVYKERVECLRINLHLLHIVVDEGFGPTTEVVEGAQMAADQDRELHRSREFDIHRSRVREDDDEAVD